MDSYRLILRILATGLLTVLVLGACGTPAPTGTALPAATPDACAPENLEAGILPVHALMREFDDTAQVAVLADVSQMVLVIPPLQAVRREAEDLQPPACLTALRTLEIDYMNSVINTLLVFMQVGAGDPQLLAEGIGQGRSLHEQYNQELARLQAVAGLAENPGSPSAVP